ncbi:MAG TPA: TIGR03435 family protein [Bryobacteraceae bacterium]|nr:TIGR03435 family protein [Bryobacteraceae bacterium]
MGIVILAILLASSPGSPQSATSNRARFEAASVKRCSSDGAAPPEAEGGRGRGGPAPADPGGLRIECRTVEDFIRIAYLWFPDGQGRPAPRSQESDPIRGAPPWTRSERYTIEAKPDGAQSSGMMRGPTLQTLLEERFALKVHREAREVPAYALAVDKGGPKLQPSKGCTPSDPAREAAPVVAGQPPPCGYQDFSEDGMNTCGSTMADLCRRLGNKLHREVIDKTGISGAFDLHLAGFSFPPPPGAPEDPAAPDPLDVAVSALQTLGLRLEAAKGTADFIVIDHVERPSEN